MSTANESQLKDAKNTLLKELVKNSPKKYTAVIVSDSDDETNNKKAILVPQRNTQPAPTTFGTPNRNASGTSPRICPKCSKVLSDSSELSDEAPKRRRHHKKHHHHNKSTGSPIIIVSPTKLSPQRASSIAKQAQLEAKLARNAEKVARRREEERRRMEAEALAKARAQVERERKERVKRILEETRRKQEAKRSYVTVYYTPDNDSESSYSSSSTESSDDEVAQELEKLQGLAGKIEKAGKKIKSMVNTSLSPEKLSPKKRRY